MALKTLVATTTWSRGDAELAERAADDLLADAEEYMSAVSKKLMPPSSARLHEGQRFLVVEHPVAPCFDAVGHHAEAEARDLEAGRAEIDVVHGDARGFEEEEAGV